MKADTLTSPSSPFSSTGLPSEKVVPSAQPLDGPLHLEQQQQQQGQSFHGEGSDGPDPGDIERAAYELYADSGYEEGHSLEHWLEAERKLRLTPQPRVA